MKMIKESPILITSCFRSGTSMIAGAINKCGAFCGEMTHQRGLFENIRIRDVLVRNYLAESNIDPEGQYPLISKEEEFIPPKWGEQISKIMLDEGYVKGKWMYKDSRIALMWRVWNQAFPNAKWILVRRRTGDIVQSCVKTGYMKAFKNADRRKELGFNTQEEAWLWWVHEYEKKFIEMVESVNNIQVIWPERMQGGDYSQMEQVVKWAGLEWNPEARTYIDSLLLGNKFKNKEVKNGTSNSR